MESNAAMNAMMNETLNIGGALLVKTFWQKKMKKLNASQTEQMMLRSQGIKRSLWGSILVAIIGLVTAVGTALVYGLGGYLVIIQTITIGTIGRIWRISK